MTQNHASHALLCHALSPFVASGSSDVPVLGSQTLLTRLGASHNEQPHTTRHEQYNPRAEAIDALTQPYAVHVSSIQLSCSPVLQTMATAQHTYKFIRLYGCCPHQIIQIAFTLKPVYLHKRILQSMCTPAIGSRPLLTGYLRV